MAPCIYIFGHVTCAARGVCNMGGSECKTNYLGIRKTE